MGKGCKIHSTCAALFIACRNRFCEGLFYSSINKNRIMKKNVKIYTSD